MGRLTEAVSFIEICNIRKNRKMKEKYYETLRHYVNPNDCEVVVEKILNLHNDRISLFQKNRLDLLNWAKSELKEAESPKLRKTTTPYLEDKITFLRRVLEWLNDEE